MSKQGVTKYALYVQRNTTVRSRKHCYKNATMGTLCIALHLYVAANNVKMFSSAMEVQQWVPYVFLSIYMYQSTMKMFSAAMEVQQWVPYVLLSIYMYQSTM